MRKQYLLILCGHPFSGKTTLAQAIVNQYDLAFVNLDEINRSRGVGIKGKPMTPRLWKETYELGFKETKKLLQGGKSVVYEGANFTELLRSEILAITKHTNIIPIIIHVATTQNECHKRLLHNRKTNSRYDVKDKDFSLVCNNFQIPTEKEAKVLTYNADSPLGYWLIENLDVCFKK